MLLERSTKRPYGMGVFPCVPGVPSTFNNYLVLSKI